MQRTVVWQLLRRATQSQPTPAGYLRVAPAQCAEVSRLAPSHSALLPFCSSDLPSAEAMNVGICVCVLLATLSSSRCLALPTHSLEEGLSDGGVVAEHTRRTRAAPPSGQIGLLSQTQEEEEVEEDPARRLNELMARIISRRASYRRSPSNSRSPNFNHRIKDRDYLGWMDFGRRSAEEYEYSS